MESGGEPDPGPGCMPAVLAATVLMGIVGFVTCGLTTWMLYGKRTELAIRTLEETYVPAVEQSLLQPEEKRAVVAQLRELTQDLKRGQFEDWQSGGVMQRLVRLPVIQWGELAAVEAWLDRGDPEFWKSAGLTDVEEAKRQLSRLRRAIELDQATSVDLNEVLRPVLIADQSPLGRSLVEPRGIPSADSGQSDQTGQRDRTDQPTQADDGGVAKGVVDVVNRAQTVADRSSVPDQRFPDVRIEAIVRRQIEAGIRDGSY